MRGRPLTRDAARLVAGAAVLVLPAATAYERQVVFEHADHAARLHGRIELEFHQRRAVICSTTAASPTACRSCGAPLARLRYIVAWQPLCGICGRRDLIAGAPVPARRPAGYRATGA